jgi:hypothetical protein
LAASAASPDPLPHPDDATITSAIAIAAQHSPGRAGRAFAPMRRRLGNITFGAMV